jgi:hypothetical protein
MMIGYVYEEICNSGRFGKICVAGIHFPSTAYNYMDAESRNKDPYYFYSPYCYNFSLLTLHYSHCRMLPYFKEICCFHHRGGRVIMAKAIYLEL